MEFHEIINAKYSKESDRAMMQKDPFPLNEAFTAYLKRYGRDVELPIIYSDLTNYSYADSLKDKKGKWTHWENAVYEPGQLQFLKAGLVSTYRLLKNQVMSGAPGLLDIERIDFCEYGNSIPFRIKVVQVQSGETDFFYIKQADASRIYGLELEHLLTHNAVNFLCHEDTLVEQHIDGIPGDVFMERSAGLTRPEKIAVAKAFVQFNENCFARLLGDMRSYNFVVNHTLIKEEVFFHFRAIDFDQQCYEGKKNFYFPQFYKENITYVELVLESLSPAEIAVSQQMEFAAMASRIVAYRRQLMEVVNSMVKDDISENYKIQALRNELNLHFNTQRFSRCKTMGTIVKEQLKQVLQKHVKKIPQTG